MSAEVHYCQRPFALVCAFIDTLLVLQKDLFNGGHAEVCLLPDAVLVEAVVLDFPAEDFHILLDLGEVFEALLSGLSILVDSLPADGRVVNVANDKALSNVWGEAGNAAELLLIARIAAHGGWLVRMSFFGLFFALLISSTLFFPYKG